MKSSISCRDRGSEGTPAAHSTGVMGNTASSRDGGKSRGTSGQVMPDGGRTAGQRFGRVVSNDDMGGSPPDSPGSAARSPLMFTPQVSFLGLRNLWKSTCVTGMDVDIYVHVDDSHDQKIGMPYME